MARTKITARPPKKEPSRGPKRQPAPIANNNSPLELPPDDPRRSFEENQMTFVFFYSNVVLHASSMHQAGEGVIIGELKHLLVNLQGPLLIDHLVDSRPFHGVTYNEHQRQLLLDLLCCLGIFTAEEHYKAELWNSIQNKETVDRNTGVTHVHQGTVCTVWLIESRRRALSDNPTGEEIRWVDEYRAKTATDEVEKVSQPESGQESDEQADFEWLDEYPSASSPKKKLKRSKWDSFSD
jgi:hypothetical protein